MSRALTKKSHQEFFETRNSKQFAQLQQLAIESDEYDFNVLQLVKLESQLNTCNPSQLLDAFEQLPEHLQVCPRYHYVAARLRESLGETERMQASIENLRACLTAIVEMAEGTQESPFSIAFVTDADDVLRSLGESTRCSAFVQNQNRSFDVMTAHSGHDFWFDVTKIVAKQPSSFIARAVI